MSELASLLHARKITSLALTQMYLARLKRYDSKLHFVISLTEERALAKAKQADAEISAGNHRGPLHGIPWGAKDLLAVKGYPTTWGAGGFEHQSFDEDATVVKRLDEAGAVLVAKFTLGALAMGDKWFGGRTRNPWNPAQGSSGSSAGSASAVAAGCVAFAIGSETLGSISSPSTRCGATGLRPSFGFVPRTGAMALSWTMDKLGPISRSAEDCALVLNVIHGPDGQDTSVHPASFRWDPDLRRARPAHRLPEERLRRTVAVQASVSAGQRDRRRENGTREAVNPRAEPPEPAATTITATISLRSTSFAAWASTSFRWNFPNCRLARWLVFSEPRPLLHSTTSLAAAVIACLLSKAQTIGPIEFRTARFYPAVEYIQANRARTLAVQQVTALFDKVDIIVGSSGGQQLLATNLTGHPALIVPNGLRGDDAPKPPKTDDGDNDDIGGPGTPVSITFLAGLYEDAKLAAFAHAYQQATSFNKQHPKLD